MGVLADYPAPPGNKRVVIATVAGPSSYTQVTPGAAPSGGQVVTAQQLGLQSIEFAEASLSTTGTYGARVIFDGNPDRDLSSIRLQWFTASTGAEASGSADLDAESVRIYAVGL